MISALFRLHELAIVAMERVFSYNMSSSRFHTKNGEKTILKKRTAPPLSYAIANAFFLLSMAKCRLLTNSDWMDRERNMYRLLYDKDVTLERGHLLIPILPGRPLNEILESSTHPLHVKAKAIATSIRALRSLHTCHLRQKLQIAPIHHSDATAANALYDPMLCQTHWIDFETTYKGFSETDKCAEDLLTLLFSCSSCLSNESFSTMLPDIMHAYDEPAVWSCAQHILLEERQRSRPYRLVQCRLLPSEKRAVDLLLINAINARSWK